MLTTLILVRHGQTEKNIDSVLHTDDDPESLNDLGRQQMELTAMAMKKLGTSVVLYSKEKRAKESAEIIARLCEADLKQIEGLHERNWGDYSGKTWPEIKELLDKMTLEERYEFVPPNGESWKGFETRLISTVKSVLDDYMGETIVLVSHGGSIRALMPYLLNVPRDESFKYSPDNASVTIFKYSDGSFESVRVNDTSHLL